MDIDKIYFDCIIKKLNKSIKEINYEYGFIRTYYIYFGIGSINY